MNLLYKELKKDKISEDIFNIYPISYAINTYSKLINSGKLWLEDIIPHYYTRQGKFRIPIYRTRILPYGFNYDTSSRQWIFSFCVDKKNKNGFFSTFLFHYFRKFIPVIRKVYYKHAFRYLVKRSFGFTKSAKPSIYSDDLIFTRGLNFYHNQELISCDKSYSFLEGDNLIETSFLLNYSPKINRVNKVISPQIFFEYFYKEKKRKQKNFWKIKNLFCLNLKTPLFIYINILNKFQKWFSQEFCINKFLQLNSISNFFISVCSGLPSKSMQRKWINSLIYKYFRLKIFNKFKYLNFKNKKFIKFIKRFRKFSIFSERFAFLARRVSKSYRWINRTYKRRFLYSTVKFQKKFKKFMYLIKDKFFNIFSYYKFYLKEYNKSVLYKKQREEKTKKTYFFPFLYARVLTDFIPLNYHFSVKKKNISFFSVPFKGKENKSSAYKALVKRLKGKKPLLLAHWSLYLSTMYREKFYYNAKLRSQYQFIDLLSSLSLLIMNPFKHQLINFFIMSSQKLSLVLNHIFRVFINFFNKSIKLCLRQKSIYERHHLTLRFNKVKIMLLQKYTSKISILGFIA